jgi:hypothetical protein
VQDSTNAEIMSDQHQRFIKFKMVAPLLSDDYMKANTDIYSRLEERVCLEPVYNMFRQSFVNEEIFDGLLRSIIQMIANHFRKGRLSFRAAAKYMGNEEAATVQSILAQYEREREK